MLQTGPPTVQVMPARHYVKLTEPMIERAAALTRQGAFPGVVAEALGVSRTTYWRWLAEGERLSQTGAVVGAGAVRLRDLHEHVRLAEAEAETEAVARIVAAGAEPWVKERTTRVESGGQITTTTVIETRPGDWRASAWFLERRFPDRWGRQAAVAASEEVAMSPGVSAADVLAKLDRMRGERPESAAS